MSVVAGPPEGLDGGNLYTVGLIVRAVDPSGSKLISGDVTIDASCKDFTDQFAIVPETGAKAVTNPQTGKTYDADGIYINEDKPHGQYGYKVPDNCWLTVYCKCDTKTGKWYIEVVAGCWPWWLGKSVTKFHKGSSPFYSPKTGKGVAWPW